MSHFTPWRFVVLFVMLLGIGTSTGCLGMRLTNHVRDQMRKNEGSFSDSPSMPKADFGREKSELKSTGSDRRAREIEASLGVGG
jgi:hypothetical protein